LFENLKSHFNKQGVGYLFLLPSVFLILLVSIYPLGHGIYLSLTDYNLLRFRNVKFIGLDNVIKIFTDDIEFREVLGFTFTYTIGVVVGTYLFGLLVALLLNRSFHFRGVFRALILIPWIIPPVVGAMVWSWSLNMYGIINTILLKLHLVNSPVPFLAKPTLARLTVICTGIWKSFPIMSLMLLAGLQSIPDELYQAAQIDGASKIQTFFRITLPLIKNISVIATTLMAIWTYNNFENIFLLTYGGPARKTTVLSIYSYWQAFTRNQIGYAAAIAVVMMVFLVVLSIFYYNRVAGEK
jgi:multiple sugar transport system permease protein